MDDEERGVTADVPPALRDPHGDLDRTSLPPPASPGDFGRIWMRGTSAVALPQLLLLLLVAGFMLPSRANAALRRGVVEMEERVGVREERYCCCCCCC